MTSYYPEKGKGKRNRVGWVYGEGQRGKVDHFLHSTSHVHLCFYSIISLRASPPFKKLDAVLEVYP